MWETRHHRFANKVVKALMRPRLFRKNNFKSEIYTLPKGRRYIILANHQTTWDPVLLVCSIKNLFYPVMAKDFIPQKHRRLAYKYIGPVLKSKNLTDLKAIKDMMTILNEGGSIMIYPEGNRTFSGELCYIDDSTAKLALKCKADLVFYNFHGGYGFDPRFSKATRKGNFYGEIRQIVKYEDYQHLGVAGVNKLIIENLTVTEAPSEYSYESNERAMYLERTLYRCPVCGQISTLHSEGNFIKCHSCGLEAECLPNLTFKANKKDFTHNTVADWFKEQEEYVRHYEIKEGETIYQDDDCVLNEIFDLEEDKLVSKGKVILTDKTLSVGDQTYNLDDVLEMTVSSKQTLIFYVGQHSYRISAPWDGFNCVKYMQMFYHITHVKNKKPDTFLGI